MTMFKKLLTTLAAAPIALALAGPASAAHIGGGMGGHMGGMGHMGGHGGMHFAGGPRMSGHVGGYGHFAGGYGHFHGDHHHHFGPRFAVGLPFYGYGPDYYYDDDYYDVGPAYAGDSVAQCQARYRSFDPASGTFLGYDGARHPCPYL